MPSTHFENKIFIYKHQNIENGIKSMTQNMEEN